MKIPDNFIGANIAFLDEKKPQTTHKIEYITKYVERWLYVVCNVEENKNINFVDCMCNAGVYSDGDLGTGMRVLKLFNEFAVRYPDKTFNLILNDIDSDRLRIIETVAKTYIGVAAKNIKISLYNTDVNEFLSDGGIFSAYFNCYPMRAANLVFVDPYNFCTVRISVLQEFLSNKYCELLFNVFTSDFVRNQDKVKMQEFCLQENITATTKAEMIEFIKTKLKTGKIKYSFSYEFKSVTNTELYQIMFFTPNPKGLEKLKEALWETFNGKEFYKNKKETDFIQLSIFSEDDDKQLMIDFHASIAKELLLKNFKGKTTDYTSIELFLIENTLLSANQIIEHVLHPLLRDNKLKKLGYVSNKSNYKQDSYRILG